MTLQEFRSWWKKHEVLDFFVFIYIIILHILANWLWIGKGLYYRADGGKLKTDIKEAYGTARSVLQDSLSMFLATWPKNGATAFCWTLNKMQIRNLVWLQ